MWVDRMLLTYKIQNQVNVQSDEFPQLSIVSLKPILFIFLGLCTNTCQSKHDIMTKELLKKLFLSSTLNSIFLIFYVMSILKKHHHTTLRIVQGIDPHSSYLDQRKKHPVLWILMMILLIRHAMSPSFSSCAIPFGHHMMMILL